MRFTFYDLLSVIGILATCELSRLWFHSRRRNQSLPLPPGPRGLPIVGNLLDMLAARRTDTLEKWKNDYGPIIHLKVFGTSYIYLNDYQLTVELFEKRGSMYSSRPHLVMNDLEGWSEWFIGALPYGPELRSLRQSLHHFLQLSEIPNYFPAQLHSARKLSERLINDPQKCAELIKYSVAELVMMITHGYEIAEVNDPFIAIAEKGVEFFADAQGFYLVNDLSWLQYLPSWLPGMGFLKVVEEGYKRSMEMYRKPYEMFKKNYEEKGQGASSLAAKLLEKSKTKRGRNADEDLVAKATSNIYAAGADTTVSALMTFILAMVLHPEVQKRAHEELDSVLGKNVLPTFDDLPKLKYIDAIRKECLRWQTVVSTTNPHTVEIDDEIDGYAIPANSVVIANIWAILRDPVDYPNAKKFLPSRFMKSPTGVSFKNPEVGRDPGRIAFSLGRRHCPGKHFAESHLFIDMATILATCNIEKTVDNTRDGIPVTITPDIAYTQQFVRHPLPFRCSIKPRNSEIPSLLHQSNEDSICSGQRLTSRPT